MHTLINRSPLVVVGLNRVTDQIIRFQFDNLDEAETKLPNLHTEFTSPMKDVE